MRCRSACIRRPGSAKRRCVFCGTTKEPQPFFLKVSFERPHSPYDPPKRWWDRYDSRAAAGAIRRVGGRSIKARSDNGRAPWHGDLGDAAVENARRGYYGSVSFVDEQIGRILETLDRQGVLKRTLIVYLSDHGDMLGDQYLWRKSYAYQGSARIPMIVHWPDGITPRVAENPVEIRDVLPTFLAAAGVPIPKGVDGVSLLNRAESGEARGSTWSMMSATRRKITGTR